MKKKTIILIEYDHKYIISMPGLTIYFIDPSVPGMDVVTVEAKSDSDGGPIQHQGFLPISTSAGVSSSYRENIITFTYIYCIILVLLICDVYQSV